MKCRYLNIAEKCLVLTFYIKELDTKFLPYHLKIVNQIDYIIKNKLTGPSYK